MNSHLGHFIPIVTILFFLPFDRGALNVNKLFYVQLMFVVDCIYTMRDGVETKEKRDRMENNENTVKRVY